MGSVQKESGWHFGCISGVRHRRLQALRTIWKCAGENVLRECTLDCGLFQGHRQRPREINEHLALPAEQVNAVALSHANIDGRVVVECY